MEEMCEFRMQSIWGMALSNFSYLTYEIFLRVYKRMLVDFEA